MNTYLPSGITITAYIHGHTWTECGQTFARVYFLASNGTTGVQTFPI